MTETFASAMRAALERTTGGDPAAATAIIQAALRGALPEGPAAGLAPAPLGRPFPGLPGGTGPAPDRPLAARPDLGRLAGLPGRARLKAHGRTPPPPVPEGASFARRTFGGREARVFLPSPREGGPAGLVLMLHGCTQTPEDFARGTRMNLAAEAAGFVVVYPAQTAAQNVQSCWNWFRPGDQGRGGEPAELARIARSVAAETGVPAGRIFAAGLSAGGAMAAILADAYPEVFAAAGVHSGLPVGAAHDAASAFAAMRAPGGGRAPAAPLIVFHGTGDAIVAPGNGRALVPGSGVESAERGNGRSWQRLVSGESELWLVAEAGHAWFGGDAAGSHADPRGPDASAEMLRFFAARG